jgi:hypothetical protein
VHFSDDAGGDYIEAVAELRLPGERSTVADWCAARELTCSAMAGGMLISGSRTRFEAAFGQAVPDRTRSSRLAPPPELRDVIESVIVLPVPHLHGNRTASRG